MADRKYLQKRGSCWYIRVPRPPRLWGKNSEFVCSLGTPDEKTARRLRDKYLMPLLAETSAAGLVESIARLAAAADETVARQLADLKVDLSGARENQLRLRDVGELFIEHLRASRAYAPASISKYATSIDAACRILGGELDPEALFKADAGCFRDTLLDMPVGWQLRKGDPAGVADSVRRISAKSVAHHLMDLRRMFRWLLDEGRLHRRDNPFDGITVARVSPKVKRAPTVEEADALLALPAPNAIDALTWRTMPLVGRYTGCRAGESAQLRAEDVVIEQSIRCLKITAHGEGKRLKTTSSERLIPIAEKLALHVDKLLARRQTGRLLDAGDWHGKDGTVKHAHAFLKYYNRRAKAVGPDLSFHNLRVYVNDQLATAGVDIGDRERLLGHTSRRTQSHYTPENLRSLKAAVDSIP